MTRAAAEEWRPIPDTAYEASSLGRIRRAKPASGARVGAILTVWYGGGRTGSAYQQVDLSHNNKRTRAYVHRLVAEAFHGKPRGRRKIVDHLDGDTENNRPENLEWVTRSENGARAYGSPDKFPWEE